jgi:uncharacterized repeat protein (TIGR01451 family)
MSSKKLFSLLVLLFLVVGLVPATIAAQPDPGNVEKGPTPASQQHSAGRAPIEANLDGVPLSAPVLPLGTMSYATEAVNGFHTQFDLDVPEVLPNLGAFNAGGNFPGAGEYVNGFVYVADTANNLYQLDPATGAIITTIPITPPPNGETYSGMALDPTTGEVYASSTNVGTSSLFTVDLNTGVATLIGPITGSGCNIAIAINGLGDLYGYDICTDDFWAIDKNTGAGTVIGSIGFDANFGQGMGWDQATDQVYMAAFNNGTFQPELRVVDLGTGNTTMVGGPLGSTDPTGLCQLPWLGVPMGVEECTWVDLLVDDFEGGMGNWTMTGLWNEEHEADACGSLAAPFPSSDTDAYFGQDGICTYGTGAPEAGVLEMVFDVDTTVAVETTLDFWSFEQTECGGGSCGYDDRLVEVSLDGGATWDTVWSSPGPEMQWYPAGVDLTPYRGLLRVRFRFDTYDDLYNDFFGWMVDDVVLAACIPEDIGWLDGSVMDSELGDTEPPCTGAVVQVEPGGVEIPVRDDGSYGPSMLISGTYTLTAIAPGFSVETAMVDITTDMTTTQDFNLWRPVIEVTPTDLISITGYVGYTETYPLLISNNGHLPLDFEIYELAPPAAAVEAARSYRPSPAAVGVDPFIYEQLAASPDGQVDFFVAFRDTADLGPAYSMNWSDRGHFVVEALQRAAHAAQGNVRAWLDERGVEYTSYWINNTLFLHADETTMNALAAFPEVSGFRGNHVNQIMPVEAPETAGQTLTPAYPWNITFPMADQVHSLFGIKGQGVVVGGMDTGVEYDHMGLVNNYRGNLGGGSFDHTYSWFDPDNACPDPDEPCDTDGHGTRTHGIMTGDDDPALPDGAWIGMAPDAQWIHCLGCPYGSCPDSVTDACAQWFLAPGGDPDMRPQVVNHSWGLWSPNDCNGNAFQAQLMAYRAADIVPAFAAGNVGDQVIPPHCYASTSPANNTDPDGNPIAFSSGAHGASGLIDSYSSGGPSACNNDNLFPDVASPGLGSCTTQLGNSYYCGFGGTSAASPHTAGCVALVRAANPVLTVDEVEQVIRDAANDVDDGCGTPPESPDWNNIYGEGHLDCFEAVEMVLQQDIPWIWEDPISGTIPAEDDVTIDVSATCTETGDLSATLRIMHNDPCLETIDVPVVLHCEEPMPDLYITKEVTPVHQVPGGLVTYTIAFGNDGSGDAMGVVVSDVLPAEVEYISSDPPGAYDAGTHELVWGPLDLERFGSLIEATVVVRIGEEVEPCTWMTNTVYLLWEAEEHMAEASHHAEEPPPPPFFYYYLPMLYKNG